MKFQNLLGDGKNTSNREKVTEDFNKYMSHGKKTRFHMNEGKAENQVFAHYINVRIITQNPTGNPWSQVFPMVLLYLIQRSNKQHHLNKTRLITNKVPHRP